MTKKDYVKAAQIAQSWHSNEGTTHGEAVEHAFVALFRSEPAFDVERFRVACKPACKPVTRLRAA